MNLEKKTAFIINFIYFMIVALIAFVALKYGIGWFLPFILAFSITLAMRPIILLITKKTKIPYKIASIVVLALFFAIVGVLISLLFMRSLLGIKDLFSMIPEFYSDSVEPAFLILFGKIEKFVSDFSPDLVFALEDIIPNLIETLGSMVTSLSKNSLALITSIVGVIPSAFIGLIFTIISSFFLTLDYDRIMEFIMKQFSPRAKSIIYDVKHYFVDSIFKILRVYALLMILTFIELSIGLSILRVNNAIAIAGLIALIDILPVLGTGGILVPWAIIEAILGNYLFAIGIVVMYLIITVIRNVLEPKIVGDQIGLHPIATLISMYIGNKVMGILGIFLFPMIVITLKKLNSTNKIHLFK
ncbi:MAG: sporulation integral membrane protein YtvI [Clostridiaceae bacterium]